MRKRTSKDAVEFVLYQPSTAGQGACSQEQYLWPPSPPHETPLEKNPISFASGYLLETASGLGDEDLFPLLLSAQGLYLVQTHCRPCAGYRTL